jgi:hypothetical protein
MHCPGSHGAQSYFVPPPLLLSPRLRLPRLYQASCCRLCRACAVSKSVPDDCSPDAPTAAVLSAAVAAAPDSVTTAGGAGGCMTVGASAAVLVADVMLFAAAAAALRLRRPVRPLDNSAVLGGTTGACAFWPSLLLAHCTLQFAPSQTTTTLEPGRKGT